MTANAGQETDLRLKDGTVFRFQGLGNAGAHGHRRSERKHHHPDRRLAGARPQSHANNRPGRQIHQSRLQLRQLVASATDPLGRMVSYTYNPAGTLATVTDAGGGTTRFYYNSQNQLTSMVDPRGATVFRTFTTATDACRGKYSPTAPFICLQPDESKRPGQPGSRHHGNRPARKPDRLPVQPPGLPDRRHRRHWPDEIVHARSRYQPDPSRDRPCPVRSVRRARPVQSAIPTTHWVTFCRKPMRWATLPDSPMTRSSTT